MVYILCKETYCCGVDVLYACETREEAEKLEFYLLDQKIFSPGDLSIIEKESFDTLDSVKQRFRRVEYWEYDGKALNRRSINNLFKLYSDYNAFFEGDFSALDYYRMSVETDEKAWKDYLSAHRWYIAEKNEYPPETKTSQSFKKKVHHLRICRPISTHDEHAIKKEWEKYLSLAEKWASEGLETEEIRMRLKQI